MLIVVCSGNNDICYINYYKIIVYSIVIILPVNRDNRGLVIKTKQNTLQQNLLHKIFIAKLRITFVRYVYIGDKHADNINLCPVYIFILVYICSVQLIYYTFNVHQYQLPNDCNSQKMYLFKNLFDDIIGKKSWKLLTPWLNRTGVITIICLRVLRECETEHKQCIHLKCCQI